MNHQNKKWFWSVARIAESRYRHRI